MAFPDALRALTAIKTDGVIEEYAIAGAMAMVFWTEPVPTFDLDVLVLLPGPQRDLISLDTIYRWAESRGYPFQDEHILIEGLPIQFVPSPSGLAREAIGSAVEIDYRGVRQSRPPRIPHRPLPSTAGQDPKTAGEGGNASGIADLETMNSSMRS